MMEKIFTPNAPKPGGHYTQAIKQGGLIFISGQLPIVPSTEIKVLGPIEEQTHQVLHNLLAIAEAGGSDLDHIIKVTVYIADMDLWSKVNEIYTQFFQKHKPARVIVPVSSLHYGFLVEMDAVAAVK